MTLNIIIELINYSGNIKALLNEGFYMIWVVLVSTQSLF